MSDVPGDIFAEALPGTPRQAPYQGEPRYPLPPETYTAAREIIESEARVERIVFNPRRTNVYTYDEACLITRWMNDKIDAFLSDDVMKQRLDGMMIAVKEEKPRKAMRRLLRSEELFEDWLADQKEDLTGFGASKKLKERLLQAMSSARLHNTMRTHMAAMGHPQAIVPAIRERWSNARKFLEGHSRKTCRRVEMRDVETDALILTMLAVNIVMKRSNVGGCVAAAALMITMHFKRYREGRLTALRVYE